VFIAVIHADIRWQTVARRGFQSFHFSKIMMDRRAFMLGSAAAVAGCKRRATGFPGYAFVANGGERSVAAVDLMRFSVARQIQLEAAPSAVLAHPNRRAVYALAPQNSTIYEMDAAELAVKRKLSLGGTAVSMRMAPGGGSLWALCRSPHALVRVALDNARFDAASRLELPGAPEDFDLSHDGLLAAASFPETGSVAVIELAKPALTNMALAGDDPRVVRFRSDGRQILVANRGGRTLTIVDVKTGGTLVRLPLPIEPEHFCVKADGGQVFITGKGMDAVVVVHPYQTEVSETRLAGKAPGAMAISVEPEYLFVTNPDSGDVTVLEVETRNVLAAVQVGQEPCYVTFTPDGQYALVVNHRSGDLAVIRVPAITRAHARGRSKTAPLFNMIPVGSGPVGAAVEAVEGTGFGI
jgi:YVTN family beta-propeller protein